MKFRAQYLLAGALVALGPVSTVPAFAESAAPSCVCPVSVVDGASVGSVSSVTGNVLVSHKASFIGAESGAPLTLGSRVVTGAKSSANLSIGGNCSVDMGANASATVIKQEQMLCVRVIGQEKTASVSGANLPPHQAEFGQANSQQRSQGGFFGGGFGFPEAAFTATIGGAIGGAIVDANRDDDDDCVSGC